MLANTEQNVVASRGRSVTGRNELVHEVPVDGSGVVERVQGLSCCASDTDGWTWDNRAQKHGNP